ncbi:MAG: hypothetical protein ACLR8Y_11620 [Alistipes indistinctus]
MHQKLPLHGLAREADRPLTLELPGGLYGRLPKPKWSITSARNSNLPTGNPTHWPARCTAPSTKSRRSPRRGGWVMVAEQPGQRIENNYLLLNLSPPCAIDNPWWIKPGKVMREVTLSTKGARELVDFAVKRGLQYIEFDAGMVRP